MTCGGSIGQMAIQMILSQMIFETDSAPNWMRSKTISMAVRKR